MEFFYLMVIPDSLGQLQIQNQILIPIQITLVMYPLNQTVVDGSPDEASNMGKEQRNPEEVVPGHEGLVEAPACDQCQ